MAVVAAVTMGHGALESLLNLGAARLRDGVGKFTFFLVDLLDMGLEVTLVPNEEFGENGLIQRGTHRSKE